MKPFAEIKRRRPLAARSLVAGLIAAFATAPPGGRAYAADEDTGRAEVVTSAATGAALQGDVRRALAILREGSGALMSPTDRAFGDCMERRFGAAGGTDADAVAPDPFIAAVVAAYRAYWRDALLGPDGRAAAEADLAGRLSGLLGSSGDMAALETELRARLLSQGAYSLQGRTGPLRELMVWRSQTEDVRTVDLPEGPHDTRVFLLDDFASLGWGDYATCGRRGAGGWATRDALYAVVPRYGSLEGEEFQVTFLGHETQHFADLARFPGIESWELEYRAKLAELARADRTRERILGKFMEDQADDPALPHSYANRRVLSGLVERLELDTASELHLVRASELNRAAESLLVADTERRTASR